MSTATLNGLRVPECRAQIPASGLWFADVKVDDVASLTGSVALKIADLEMVGTIISGGVYEGVGRYRVQGGAGRWGHTIPAKDYSNDAGVKLSTVISDAAQAAGEPLDTSTIPAGIVGTKWSRVRGPSSWTLQALLPGGWYVGEDGVTRCGSRPAAPYTVPAERTSVDLARGRVELAAGVLTGLVPGAVVEGLTAVDVEHVVADRTVRSVLWGQGVAPGSRRLAAFRVLLDRLLPDYRYRGVYECRVVTQEGERLNLQPVRSGLGLPDLRRVRVRPGVPGVKALHALGSLVLVAFVDADPGRAVVVSADDAESPGWMPLTLTLGDAPVLGVARQTDAVVAGPFGGTIVGGSVRVRAGL